MGDDDRRPPAQRVVEGALDRDLRLRVEVRRRFVEDHDRGVLEEDARDREALLLSTRHAIAALADDGVEPVRERGDDVPDARRAQRGLELGVGRFGPGEREVGANRVVEEVRVLRARGRPTRATNPR